MQENKMRIRIECDTEFKFTDFIDVLAYTNALFETCYDKYNEKIKNDKEKIDYKENQPSIASVGNGCVLIDVVVPIACALIPIIYDVVKSYRNKKIGFNSDKKELVIYSTIIYDRMKWVYDDTYEFTLRAYKIYVLKKLTTSPDDFLKKLPANFQKYGRNSLLCKLFNTKALLEKNGINNTLNCKSLPHCSKEHENAFNQIMAAKGK